MQKIIVELPTDTFEEAACLCARQGRSLSNLVAKALSDRLYIERGLERLVADIRQFDSAINPAGSCRTA